MFTKIVIYIVVGVQYTSTGTPLGVIHPVHFHTHLRNIKQLNDKFWYPPLPMVPSNYLLGKCLGHDLQSFGGFFVASQAVFGSIYGLLIVGPIPFVLGTIT